MINSLNQIKDVLNYQFQSAAGMLLTREKSWFILNDLVEVGVAVFPPRK